MQLELGVVPRHQRVGKAQVVVFGAAHGGAHMQTHAPGGTPAHAADDDFEDGVFRRFHGITQLAAPEDRVACIPLKLTERNKREGGD
jgi:hypothetical protein